MPGTFWSTLLPTVFALMMFAANSLLCRMALGGDSIDWASYSSIRMASGALMLLLIVQFRSGIGHIGGGDWKSAGFLFLYAVPFSFAYTGLSTGTGALILFASVQTTMMITAWRSGERAHMMQWMGFVLAVSGLVYLLLPRLDSPPPLPALFMIIAGSSWGIYSILGRAGGDPLRRTTGNFLRTLPMVLLISIAALPMMRITAGGVVLAVVSGAMASALGYVAWYAALKNLRTMQASVLQLVVPVLAALAGVLVLSEVVSLRLVVASVLVIGGVALAVVRRTTAK